MILFEPSSINKKLNLVNRVVMPAVVTRLSTTDGHVTPELIERYLMYAKGGTGLVITEAVSVKEQKSGQLLRLNSDEFVSGLQDLTHQVHSESQAKIAPQIIHFLKISRSGYRQTVEDLSLEEIEEIPRLFAEASARTRDADFDAVELHFAHAYTMASFLSRHNRRKDDYGGNLKKRLRLAIEVVAATRKAVGDDFVIGARINGDEFTLGGNSIAQTNPIALGLAEEGLDYISVSAGGRFEDAIPCEGEALDPYTGYSGHRTMPPRWMPEKVNSYLAGQVKATLNHAGHQIPVITAGRIPTAEIANLILKNGDADLVGIARPILCDPYWPLKSKEGRERDILKCTYCNHCRESEGAFEEVTCIQWKKKDGSRTPPTP